jgi:hypothetical protein
MISILPFNLRDQKPMATTWLGRLNSASSETDVITVVKDFVAELTPQDVARLPVACRPGKFLDSDDVTSLALTLVRHDCNDAAGSSRLVQKMSSFFSSASIRLSEILATASTSASESRQSA